MAADKDTIYIDIDDEITGIIDKLQASNSKLVALVLPKRATVFQSIVNMKLLKRAADSANKNLVLITSEAGLMPLAGAAGVYVAKSLTSKPEVPTGPQLPEDNDEAVPEETAPLEDDGQPIDANKPVGELAGAGPAAAAADGVETLELPDDEPAAEAAATEPAAKSAKPKKDKKLAVPNFERFRLWLLLGAGGLVLLIILFFLLTSVLAKATINIKTDATNVNTNLELNLSTTAKQLDASSGTIPAKLASQQKTYSQQVPTTGQKNNGNKASGSVTMTATVCGTIPDGGPSDVPAGSGLSSNGLTYITQERTSFNSTPAGPPSHGCLSFSATDNTKVIAQSGGSNYNGANTFTVAGRSDVSAKVAQAISGGTDNVVHSVNQNDINSAKSKISANNDSAMKQTLADDLKKENYFAIIATFTSGTPNVTSSAQVGDTADNVTVTETITYTMFGVPQNDLNTLVENDIKGQIDAGKQSILDNGLDHAVFNVDNMNNSSAQLTMSGTAEVGPDLDVANIQSDAAGKKPGVVKSDLSNNPDVVGVDVKLSPFWVSSVPKKASHIKVVIAKPTTTKASDGNQ